ncbi:MAG: ferritin-like domain-containing protein [Thermoleophilia bacterium]|nr:ferritin-like domain-containing protein [Thermoleophilia bacterium]
MAITREELIDLLNKDLEWEFAALIQYVQHAAALTGAAYGDIQKELLIHANEEHIHAVSLAEQIDFLGGVPTVDVERRLISPDPTVMLEQDLGGEQDAIDRYKARIRQAEELQEYGLRRALEDILIVEEEHKRDLLAALGR